MRLEGPMGSYGDREEDPGLHGGMGLDGIEKKPITPEAKETRESFREITIIDTSKDDPEGMKRQIEDIKDGSGLDVTSCAKRPDGTVDLMLQKTRNINHKSGWSYNPELYKEQQAS